MKSESRGGTGYAARDSRSERGRSGPIERHSVCTICPVRRYSRLMPVEDTVVDLFKASLGLTPRGIVAKGGVLQKIHLDRLMDARSEAGSIDPKPRDLKGQIWPLMSHHTYNRRALFGVNRQDILPRALTLLLIHDGLVVADPLETVRMVYEEKGSEKGVFALNRAVQEIAEVEDLITGGVLRLTELRPTLDDPVRLALLDALGLDENMLVFNDFLQAAEDVRHSFAEFDASFAPQVQELYMKFGMRVPRPGTLDEAFRRVRELGAAILEVTWQFAVATLDPHCDMAIRDGIESWLAHSLVEQGAEGALGEVRHLDAMELGRVPNLDPSRLSVSDALVLRRHDAFEGFRSEVRSGLDRMEESRLAGISEERLVAVFEERMTEESRRLYESIRRTSLRKIAKDSSVPAALGVVAQFGGHSGGNILDGGSSAAIAGGVSLATVLWAWMNGRNAARGHRVACRYFSMLGGVS